MNRGYEVIWSTAAESELAELWVTARDRASLADAADRIDGLLRSAAHSAGESRVGDERIVISLPLIAFVRVDATARRVVVSRIRRL